MIALLRRLHRWAGLVAGLTLGVVAVSGGLLLFEDEYLRVRYPPLARPAAGDVAARGEALERLFAAVPAGEVRNVRLPTDTLNGFEVWLEDGSQVYADGRGEVLERFTWRDSAPAFVFDLHAHLLAGDAGHTVNGVVAVAGIFFVMSGVVLWWPGRRGAYRPSRAWPRGFSGPELLRSHAAAGILTALPLALFAITGAAIVFHGPASSALGLLDQAPRREPTAVVAARPGPVRPWREVLAAAEAAFGEGRVVMVAPGHGANRALRFRKRLPGEWHPNGRSYVLVDPYDARVVEAVDARAQGFGTRLSYALYPVHAARGAGRVLLVPALVAAVGTGWLAFGGLLAWMRRRMPSTSVPAAAAAGAVPHQILGTSSE